MVILLTMRAEEIIRQIIDYKGIDNIKAFSEIIGLDRPQAIYDIQKGKTKSISISMANKIISVFPEFSKFWLLTGDGEMLSTKEEKDSKDYRLVPLCSQDVVGGSYNQDADTNGYIIGYIPFVNANQEDIAVQVTNNSMYPTYLPGTIVQIRKLEYWRKYIEFGQVHIIELLDDRRLIKEVRKGSDDTHLRLVSHNKDYDETEIPIDFIRSVWLVLAKFQKVVL